MKLLTIILFIYSAISFSKEKKINLSDLNYRKEERPHVLRMSQLEFILRSKQLIEINIQKLGKRLNDGEIIGLELLIADTTKAQVESRFGHALFRFVDSNRKAANDMVVGYVAQVDTPGVNYFKGLFGGYALVPEIKPLREYHQQYAGDQERFLDRYLISSTPQLRQSIFNQLVEEWNTYKKTFDRNLTIKTKKLHKRLIKSTQKRKERLDQIIDFYGNIVGFRISKKGKVIKTVPINFKLNHFKVPTHYTFLQNNCSGAIVNLLRRSGLSFLPKISLNSIIPIKLDDYLMKNHLINFRLNKIPIVTSRLIGLLKITKQDYSSLKSMEVKKLSKIIAENIDMFDVIELYAILDNFNVSEGVLEQIYLKISEFEIPTYEEVYEIENVDKLIYKLCLDKSCRSSFKKYDFLEGKRKSSYPRGKVSSFLNLIRKQSEVFSIY